MPGFVNIVSTVEIIDADHVRPRDPVAWTPDLLEMYTSLGSAVKYCQFIPLNLIGYPAPAAFDVNKNRLSNIFMTYLLSPDGGDVAAAADAILAGFTPVAPFTGNFFLPVDIFASVNINYASWSGSRNSADVINRLLTDPSGKSGLVLGITKIISWKVVATITPELVTDPLHPEIPGVWTFPEIDDFGSLRQGRFFPIDGEAISIFLGLTSTPSGWTVSFSGDHELIAAVIGEGPVPTGMTLRNVGGFNLQARYKNRDPGSDEQPPDSKMTTYAAYGIYQKP